MVPRVLVWTLSLFATLVGATLTVAQVVGTPGTPGAPSAFGLSGGQLAGSFSAAYESRNRGGLQPTRFDASTAALLGFGDPVDGIGYQVGVNITSTRAFGKSGHVTLGAHKLFQTSDQGVYAVAANLDYLIRWGEGRYNRSSGNLLVSYLTGFGPRLGLVTVGLANSTS